MTKFIASVLLIFFGLVILDTNVDFVLRLTGTSLIFLLAICPISDKEAGKVIRNAKK